MDIIFCIDSKELNPKEAKLKLLTLAGSLDSLKARVVEGIADMLTKLPFDAIVDKKKVGEVDHQIRYYEPLLSSMLSDNIKKVILRWPNKTGNITSDIRANAIISTLIQSRFGSHIGYGEVKPGDDSTTIQSLCIATLKLVVLTKNNCLKKGSPVLSFQVNGFQLIFYLYTFRSRVYTMTEIGRIEVPNSLASIQSFVTFKNLQVLLYVTQVFWYCCFSDSSPNYVPPPPPSPDLTIANLLNMASNSSSKFRDCPVNYY
ncbi:hypothetical protein BD770DRAFT_412409 [Pilaira anomala]|nr:hypothetical protein BD770DRAFT_412409 [Pilaira anomala]